MMASDDKQMESSTGRSLLRSILSNWVGMLIAGLVSFVLTPILIHGLGEFYYGMWVLVASLIGYYGLLDMGLRVTVQRFIARFQGANQREELNQTFTTAVKLTLAISSLVIILIPCLILLLPRFFRLQGAAVGLFRWLIILLALDVAVVLPVRLLGTYLCALQRFDLYNMAAIAVDLSRALLFVVVLRLGWGVLGVGAAALAVTLLSLPVHWYLLRRVDPGFRILWSYASWSRVWELASFSFYILLNTVGDRLRSYSDAIVIGRVLGVAMITPFIVAARLMEYYKSLLVGVSGPLMPAISSLDGQNRGSDARSLFIRATRMTTLLSVFIATMLFVDGRQLLYYWVGEGFVSSYVLVEILTVGYLLSLVQAPTSVLLIARGQHRPMGWWTLGEGVANLVLSIYWARQYGLVGIALGTMVPMVVTKTLIQPWYLSRVLNLPLLQYMATALRRPLVAGGAFILMLHVVSPALPITSRGLFLVVVLGQTVLFAVLAYLLGFTREDREFVWTRSRGVMAGAGLAIAKVRLG